MTTSNNKLLLIILNTLYARVGDTYFVRLIVALRSLECSSHNGATHTIAVSTDLIYLQGSTGNMRTFVSEYLHSGQGGIHA